MKIAVWDTYVPKKDGTLMHFDILVNAGVEEKVVLGYGATYLKNKPVTTKQLTSKECSFCHVEKASDAIESQLKTLGYAIIELSNCD